MAAQIAFHRVPQEIWENIVAFSGKPGIAALTLVSRSTYPSANEHLYSEVEISMCKSSPNYLTKLARALSTRKDLAALCMSLLVDMSITCPVKSASELENRNFGPSGASKISLWHWLKRNEEPKKSNQEWNRIAVSMLENDSIRLIMSQLTNVRYITIILGTFKQDPNIPASILRHLPLPAHSKVKSIKLRDLALDDEVARIDLFSSLTSIDLAYVAISKDELRKVLEINQGSLEVLRLGWVKESNDERILENCQGLSLRNLRVFDLRGSHISAGEAIFKDILGECDKLQEFHLRSISQPASQTWVAVLEHLTEKQSNPFLDMRSVSFGAPASCTRFWEMVSVSLGLCGDRLQSMNINGQVRGISLPFPKHLAHLFNGGMLRQPKLTKLTVMWRDHNGVGAEIVKAFESFVPSVEQLHLSLSFPGDNAVEDLSSLFQPLSKLRCLHLVFPTALADPSTAEMHEKLNNCIANNGTLLQQFWKRVVEDHPTLESISWSTYEAMVFMHPRLRHSGKASFVKVLRGYGTSDSPKFVNQLDIYRKFESTERDGVWQQGTVGPMKVLLRQKPGWREDMGNPLNEGHEICDFPEVEGPDDSVKPHEL